MASIIEIVGNTLISKMFGKQYREIDKKILNILVPAILENALLVLSGMILTCYIGRLNVDEISSYGIGNRIFNIYFAVFKGFAIGALVILARLHGSGERKKCADLFKESLAIYLPLSLLVSLLFVFFPKPLLALMTKDETLLELGSLYLRSQILCYPMVTLVHLNSSAFQSTGNTRTPLFIAIIGNIFNIIFGYVLIFGLGPIKAMGLVGAGVARTIGYFAMVLVGFYLLYGKNGLYEGLFEWKIKILKDDFILLIKTGIPAALENSCWNVATVYVSRAILGYGQTYYAAYQLGLEAEGFCDMMSSGFMTASMALAAHAIGAKDDERYKISYKRLNVFTFAISIITMAFLLLFSGATLRLLTDKPELIAIAITYLHAMIFSQFPQHKQKVTLGYIRSSGYTGITMIINMVGVFGFRLISIFLVTQVFKLSIYWAWWCFNLDQFARYIISEVFLRKTKLLDNACKGEIYGKQMV